MVEEHDSLVGLPKPLLVGGGTNAWEERRRERSTWSLYAPDMRKEEHVIFLDLPSFHSHNTWKLKSIKKGRPISNEYVITAKSYILNQNWNQSDPDVYPETQPGFWQRV